MLAFNHRVVWIPVKNTTGETIPGCALMRVIDPGQDADGNWLVAKPNADGDTNVIVNGEAEIPAGQFGLGHRDTMAVLLYDTTEDRPLTGDSYGSKNGSWQSHLGKAGFRVDSAGNGRANATRQGGGLPRAVTCSRPYTGFFTTADGPNGTSAFEMTAKVDIPYQNALVIQRCYVTLRPSDNSFITTYNQGFLDVLNGFTVSGEAAPGSNGTIFGGGVVESHGKVYQRTSVMSPAGDGMYIYYGSVLRIDSNWPTFVYEYHNVGLLTPAHASRIGRLSVKINAPGVYGSADLRVTAVEIGAIDPTCYLSPSPPAPSPTPSPPSVPPPPSAPPAVGPEQPYEGGGEPLDPVTTDPGPIPPIYFPPWYTDPIHR